MGALYYDISASYLPGSGSRSNLSTLTVVWEIVFNAPRLKALTRVLARALPFYAVRGFHCEMCNTSLLHKPSCGVSTRRAMHNETFVFRSQQASDLRVGRIVAWDVALPLAFGRFALQLVCCLTIWLR